VATSRSWFPKVRQLWAKLQDAWHGEAKQRVVGRPPGDHVLVDLLDRGRRLRHASQARPGNATEAAVPVPR
jgi:hypothetical protein